MNPDPIAAADQAAASVEQVARVVAAYYLALLKAGIPRELADSLTVLYQSAHFGAQ